MEFRQVEREDLPLLRDWRNQDNIRKATREYRLLNMLNQEEWFEDISLNRENEMFIGYKKDIVAVCGLTHINWKDRHAEISYYSTINNALKNLGIAKQVYDFLKKKAFGEYNLNRLWGEVYSCNKVALKIAQRNGLKIEGRLKETNFWEGKYYDSFITAILAKEYYGG